MPSKLGLLKVQVRSMLETLQKNSGSRTDRVTTLLAERFNKLLEAVKAQLPDFADSLPTPITSNGHHAMLGYSDANQVDLAVYLEELSSVVNYADE